MTPPHVKPNRIISPQSDLMSLERGDFGLFTSPSFLIFLLAGELYVE
jgi:hypothetical protein